MDRENYIQTSATTRVYEKGLLDKQTFERLIESEDTNEFKRLLSETSYPDAVNLIDSRKELDETLDKVLVDMFKDYYRATIDSEVVEILASEYIFHNLKTVLKSYILEEDLTHLLIRITDYDYEGLYEELKDKGRVDYTRPFGNIINAALDEYEETKDPQRLDMTMDKFQNEYMLSLAEQTEKLESPLITKWVKNLIDVQNINMTLRGKKQNHRVVCVAGFLIEGGNIPTDTFTQFYFEDIEQIVEELKRYDIYDSVAKGLDQYKEDGKLLHIREQTLYFLDEVGQEGKKVTYGPEVLFAYMLKKIREVQLIRIIVSGKINGLTPDQIRERTGDRCA